MTRLKLSVHRCLFKYERSQFPFSVNNFRYLRSQSGDQQNKKLHKPFLLNHICVSLTCTLQWGERKWGTTFENEWDIFTEASHKATFVSDDGGSWSQLNQLSGLFICGRDLRWSLFYVIISGCQIPIICHEPFTSFLHLMAYDWSVICVCIN